MWSDNDALARFLGEYWGIPVGRPDDVEDTHFTRSGPAGVNFSDGPRALITNNGRNKWALMEGGGAIAVAGATATATSGTSLTNSGASYTSNQFVNCILIAGSGSGAVYGNIVSNTATVITVERWNNFATPGRLGGLHAFRDHDLQHRRGLQRSAVLRYHSHSYHPSSRGHHTLG